MKLNHYDATGTRVVRVSTHRTTAAQKAALARARQRGEIVAWAGGRLRNDPPTCHH